MDSVRHREGRDRLVLVYEKVGEDGFNFYSLNWDKRAGDRWDCYKSITEEAFWAGRPCRRWVSKLHGFGRDPGTAVIQVAEFARPNGGSVTYSWRLWDLERNEELKMLHECRGPFEPWPGGSFET
jgi:hypothetical protein